MNSNIALVTDSDASLPAQVIETYGIYQVPISIHFGEEVFKAGEDIDDRSLFERIDRDGRLPTTAAPSPGDFGRVYQAAADAGAREVLCFCVSGKVSATVEAALAGRQLVGGVDVKVVDTQSLSMGQGFMVLAAAQALAEGASRQEAAQRALKIKDRTHLFAALSTLEYLAMSGRVGQLAAGMANLLSVKPILSIQDGSLDLLERVRTQKRAWQRLVELVQQAEDGRGIERMAFVHVDAADALAQFRKGLCAQVPCPAKPLVAELTPGLSVHAGKGVVGVAFVTAEAT